MTIHAFTMCFDRLAGGARAARTQTNESVGYVEHRARRAKLANMFLEVVMLTCPKHPVQKRPGQCQAVFETGDAINTGQSQFGPSSPKAPTRDNHI